jgi:prolyl-tRNA synthetase
VRLSKLFTKTLKQAPADQESLNGRLLTRAGFIYQEISGVYTFLPLGLRVLRKIEQIVREEMDAIGGVEMEFSTLGPSELWEKTGRLETVDVLFKASGANKASEAINDRTYILNPTHEELAAPLVKSYTFSYKDLPVLLYQFQTKFRNEPRPRAGLMRTREFLMEDLYSFHSDDASFAEFYQVAAKAYKKVFERLGLGAKTYYTYASGGSFTEKYSHEFQTIMSSGEDTIYICQNCQSEFGTGLAYNKEVVLPDSSAFKCLQCKKSDFVVEKASEVGNIFPLETRFPQAFDFKFTAADGSQKYPVMGSYGIGVSRLLGVLAEVFADDQGIAWPENVAPFRVHLIDLNSSNPTNLTNPSNESSNVYEKLTASGVETLFDDRFDVSAGEKFADADLIGCPWQVIVSKKSLAAGRSPSGDTAGGAEVRRRGEKQGKIMDITSVGAAF